MATWLHVVVWLMTLPLVCNGGIVVKESETSSTNTLSWLQNKTLVEKVTKLNHGVGKEVIGIKDVMALFLAEKEAIKLCEWLENDDDDGQLLTQEMARAQVPWNLTGIDLIISDFGEKRCHLAHLHKMCSLVPMHVNTNTNYHPGSVSTYIFSMNERNRIATEECYVLEGWFVDPANKLSKVDGTIRFSAQISMDEAVVFNLYRSIPVQLIFRVVVPVCYLFVTFISGRNILERKRVHGKVGEAHGFVLGMNSFQGIALCVLNIFGLHGFGETFDARATVIMFTNFFSLSVATDLVFSRLLHDVLRGFKFRAKTSLTNNNTKWIILALGIIAVEFFPLLLLAIAPTITAWTFVSVFMPAGLVVCSFCITGYLVYQMREIAHALMDAHRSSGFESVMHDPRVYGQYKLAKMYYFWTKVSILSIILPYIAAFMTMFGLIMANPMIFLAIVFMLDFGKISNMLAQSMSCRSPMAISASTVAPKTSSQVTVSPNRDNVLTQGATSTTSASTLTK